MEKPSKIFVRFCLNACYPLGLFLLIQVNLTAQQWPYQKQFRQVQSLLNPAAVNADYLLYEYNATLQASYRTQWISFPETPRTYHISGEYLTSTRSNFEILTGGYLMRDQTGPFSTTSGAGRIGVAFTRDPYLGLFSAALNVGWSQYRVDASRIQWDDLTDEHIPINDITAGSPDITLGIFYSKRLSGIFFDEDNVYAGLSAPQLLNVTNRVTSGDREVLLRHVPHIFLTAGWYHFFNESAYFEFAGWAKYIKGAPLNVDLSFRLQPIRTLWVGAGFNVNGLIHMEGGFNIPGLFYDNAGMRLGYAFDYNLAALDLPLGPSHEFTLAIFLDTYAQPVNPRF